MLSIRLQESVFARTGSEQKSCRSFYLLNRRFVCLNYECVCQSAVICLMGHLAINYATVVYASLNCNQKLTEASLIHGTV